MPIRMYRGGHTPSSRIVHVPLNFKLSNYLSVFLGVLLPKYTFVATDRDSVVWLKNIMLLTGVGNGIMEITSLNTYLIL